MILPEIQTRGLIFLIYMGGCVVYILWILYFLKRRIELDYMLLAQLSQQQSTVIELIGYSGQY
ncbi:hypothetical protein U3A58_02860 [Algoriphagus sp. C2-6-M1]|uniref:hypothetical protein n=1 Tax=Algoriphagus persicinus TaxID=3108754 RepID=UPI002B3FF699|nr:hypothetical protein [Algoriphagus sp. C2-6-M1]MEB2779321.1 hypothetical protein [Algoriphagus sp. C2-6-M1]